MRVEGIKYEELTVLVCFSKEVKDGSETWSYWEDKIDGRV